VHFCFVLYALLWPSTQGYLCCFLSYPDSLVPTEVSRYVRTSGYVNNYIHDHNLVVCSTSTLMASELAS